VLDIGCGTGDILVHLRGFGIELYGIDPSQFMLELAEKNIRRARPNSLPASLSRGSNRHIPFDREFDIIFSSLSFHHWEERNKSIPAILAKLSHSGEFIIYEYDRETMSFFRRSVIGKHSLSKADVAGLHFDGYTKRVEHSGSVIIVSLQKTAY
jgi:SAM-dependent methyltransferase